MLYYYISYLFLALCRCWSSLLGIPTYLWEPFFLQILVPPFQLGRMWIFHSLFYLPRSCKRKRLRNPMPLSSLYSHSIWFFLLCPFSDNNNIPIPSLLIITLMLLKLSYCFYVNYEMEKEKLLCRKPLLLQSYTHLVTVPFYLL